MGIFFKASDKELLLLRNNIFLQKGIPALTKNGFKQSPFTASWFGKNNLGDYTYEMCRLNVERGELERITTHISKGDVWIKIYLNIFALHPAPHSSLNLEGIDGIQFSLLPNSQSEMRLRSDGLKVIPLFNFVHHKIGSYNSLSSLQKRANQLANLIEKDLTNIDCFIERWHELHVPLQTSWDGHVL